MALCAVRYPPPDEQDFLFRGMLLTASLSPGPFSPLSWDCRTRSHSCLPFISPGGSSQEGSSAQPCVGCGPPTPGEHMCGMWTHDPRRAHLPQAGFALAALTVSSRASRALPSQAAISPLFSLSRQALETVLLSRDLPAGVGSFHSFPWKCCRFATGSCPAGPQPRQTCFGKRTPGPDSCCFAP